jgi:hypothetical protein
MLILFSIFVNFKKNCPLKVFSLSNRNGVYSDQGLNHVVLFTHLNEINHIHLNETFLPEILMKVVKMWQSTLLKGFLVLLKIPHGPHLFLPENLEQY